MKQMHMKTQMISARIRARAKGFSSRRYMSYGLAALVPAMGLVGAARADAPAPTSGFTPIEISADIDADITSPAAASVDLHLEQDAVGIADEAEDILEDLGTGGASYYGPNLKGNRTASGEVFDPTELTAAHRTLPMGSSPVLGACRGGQEELGYSLQLNPRHRRRRRGRPGGAGDLYSSYSHVTGALGARRHAARLRPRVHPLDHAVAVEDVATQ